MHIQNKGYGIAAPGFVVLGFLVLRPLIESLLGRGAAGLHHHLNAAVLAFAGVASFTLAARLDKKSGIDVFSRYAWREGFLESRHSIIYLPLRTVGVLFVLISLFL